MKKLFLLTLALCGLSYGIGAQTLTESSGTTAAQNGGECATAPTKMDSKQTNALINSIKRDTRYIYGESVYPTKEEAVDMAKEDLISKIMEWIKEQNTSGLDQITLKELAEVNLPIHGMRGPLHRGFVYVKKGDILPEVAEAEEAKWAATQAAKQTAEQIASIAAPASTATATTIVTTVVTTPATTATAADSTSLIVTGQVNPDKTIDYITAEVSGEVSPAAAEAITQALQTTVVKEQASEADMKSLINDIKRNPQEYIYAEDSSATADEAIEMARIELADNISFWLSSQQDPAAKTIDVNEYVAKAKSIQTMRGTLHRSFVYIHKGDLLPSSVPAPAAVEETAPAATATPVQPVTAAPVQVATAAPVQVATAAPVQVAMPAQTTAVYDEVEPEPTIEPEPVVEPEPEENEVEARYFPFDSLGMIETIDEFKELCEQYKDCCAYGPVNRNTDQEMVADAYLILFSMEKPHKITAILDKRDPVRRKRLDLITQEEVGTLSLKGNAAMWLMITK